MSDTDTKAELGAIGLYLAGLSTQIYGLQKWTALLFLVQSSIAIKLWFF